MKLPHPGGPPDGLATINFPLPRSARASTIWAAFTSACCSCPQALHTNTAWLSRLSPCTCPQERHSLEEFFGGTTHTSRPYQRALYSNCRRISPQQWSRIARLSRAFCATLRPGCPTVPCAEALMFLTTRSSSASSEFARVMLVVSFCSALCFRLASRCRHRPRRRTAFSQLLDPFWRRLTIVCRLPIVFHSRSVMRGRR